MFDIGFSEMLVIAIVALVVIGPERLPKVARTAGHLLGRLQRYVSDVKADINREMQLEELKKLQAEIQESARSVEHSLTSELQSAREAVSQTARAATDGSTRAEPLEQLAAAPTPPAVPGNTLPSAPGHPPPGPDPDKPNRAS